MPDARGWAVVAYATIFPSMLAQVFYMRGAELTGPNRAGLFVDTVPVFGMLVMGGIWLAERSGRRRDARDPG